MLSHWFSKLSTLSVLVLFMLSSSPVQARSIAVEQPEVATALKLQLPSGELAHYRLRISTLTETVRLKSSRRLHLEANQSIPASVEGGEGVEPVLLNFEAVL